MKIVGDNVTKKDYDDFWNSFHEESTGEKLNWAANQMQAKPQKQTPPQNRRSQDMMQWAMQERENLTKPQSPGRYGWLSSEEGQKALDKVSMALAAASLVPGMDTFTDMASIPVDLFRGDYMSALFDTVGLIPFVGEVGDTAKLAKIGVDTIDVASDASRAIKAGAEVIENADNIADLAKHSDDVYDVLKNTDDIAEDIYSARKVDGTIQGYLDSVDDPIEEMGKMSKSIAKRYFLRPN